MLMERRDKEVFLGRRVSVLAQGLECKVEVLGYSFKLGFGVWVEGSACIHGVCSRSVSQAVKITSKGIVIKTERTVMKP